MITLEQALVDLESQIETAEKSARIAVAELKKAKSNASAGQLRELSKSLVEARNAAKRFADEAAVADSTWKFDAESYFSSGGYLLELQNAAKAVGLSLAEKDGRIYCFPMLLTLSAKDMAVQIDKKPERKVRPRELVKLLLSRQKRPQRFNEQKLLETLFDAYRYLGGRYQKGWAYDSDGPSPAVPLVAIHELLTLLPGSERSYSKEEFARDIYLLARRADLRTKDGRSFSLPASTGSKVGGQRLTVVDQNGSETTYVSIRFQKE